MEKKAVFARARADQLRQSMPQQWIRVDESELQLETMRDTEEGVRSYLEGAIRGGLGRECWLTDVEVKTDTEFLPDGWMPGQRRMSQESITLVLTVRVGGPC